MFILGRSIDWVYYPDIQKYAVNDFEAMQIPYRRSVRDLALPRQIREELLQTEWDVTAAEMAKAIREVNRVKNQRRNTIHHRKSGWERVDRVVERTSATVMRSLKLKKVSHLLDQNTALAQELERQYFRSQEEEHQQQQQIEESEELMVESTSHSSSSPLDDNSDYANYCSTMPDSSPTPLLPPDFEHHPHPESYISQVRRARTKNGDDISEALIEALASKLWNSSFASRNKPKSDDSKNTVSYYEGNGGNYEYDFEFDVDDERSEYFIDPDCSYHPHQVGSYNCDDHAEDDASESWGRYGMLGRSADGVK